MRKVKYIFISLLVISTTVFGQFRSETLRKADKLYENHKIYEAIDYYLKAIEEAPYMQEVVYKVASLYKNGNAPKLAEKWYEEVLKFKKQDYVLVKFEYAVVLKQLGKYEKAVQNFEEFIKYYRGNDKSDFSKIVDKLIKGCDRAMMSESNDSYEVINLLEANSTYTDLSPYVYNDTLYFSSIKTDTPLTYLDDIGINIQMNLQKVGFDVIEDTVKGKVKSYGPSKTPGDNTHFSGAMFSADGQTMFFTKCITDINFNNHCDIYGSKLKKGKWNTPVKLGPMVNDESGLTSSTHPCLAPHRKGNKNVLYFSSDRVGGQGGYDLWAVDIDNNFVCTRANNLGRKINSSGNEITPSFDKESQTLYYSSNGLIGFGGYDIFKVKKKGRKLKKPSGLEGPFNGSADEFFFQSYGKDKYIMVSNREGAKKYHGEYVLDDMFIVRKKQIIKYLFVTVSKEDSILTMIDSANIQLVSIDTSRAISSKQIVRVYTGKEYTISSDINEFINDSKTVLISAQSPDTMHIRLVVSKVEEEKEIQLKNIYFAFNSVELNDSSKNEINLLYTILINNPQFKIEIGAHTDDIGKDEANTKLSQKRAESVVNYLITKNIAINRLVAKGYGESKPIALNKNLDGSDNPEGRQLNRRIVFKIIGLIELETKPIDTPLHTKAIIPDTMSIMQGSTIETEIDSLHIDSISSEPNTPVQIETIQPKDTTQVSNIDTNKTKLDSLQLDTVSSTPNTPVQIQTTQLKDTTQVSIIDTNKTKSDLLQLDTVSFKTNTPVQIEKTQPKDTTQVKDIDTSNTKAGSSSLNAKPDTSGSSTIELSDTTYKVQVGAFRKKLDTSIFKGIGQAHFTYTSSKLDKYFTGSYDTYEDAQLAKKNKKFRIY